MGEPKPPEHWDPRNLSGRPSVGLIASGTRRLQKTEGGKTLSNLLENHRETFSRSFLFVTWGTYVDIFMREDERAEINAVEGTDRFELFDPEAPRWRVEEGWTGKGYSLRPGKRGGILEMAEHLEKSAGVDRIRTLIFLTDPKDLEESYPEDNALVRSAMRNDVLYLSSFRSASLWAAYEADSELSVYGQTTTKGSEGPPCSGSDIVLRTKPEEECLALIAHNKKKLELCRWVVENTARLSRFERFVTTGTTGDWVKKFLTANGVSPGKIAALYTMESGPSGGDIEIAGEILRGRIQNVVFFVDPTTSHPHEADIRAFLRICSMPGVSVNLRLTEVAASSWIKTIDEAA